MGRVCATEIRSVIRSGRDEITYRRQSGGVHDKHVVRLMLSDVKSKLVINWSEVVLDHVIAYLRSGCRCCYVITEHTCESLASGESKWHCQSNPGSGCVGTRLSQHLSR